MNAGKVYDISAAIDRHMPVWPGNPPFSRVHTQSIQGGADADVSIITMGSHTGTHVDAPAHFIADAPGVDQISLDVLTGQAIVFEIGASDRITTEHLVSLDLNGVERALFKTSNSLLWSRLEFTPGFVSFALSGAEYLAEKGVKLVGIDYLSVGPFENGAAIHRLFLERGIVVVEGLNLADVEPGRYELTCLPLKIVDGDGAPARAILRR